MGGWWLVISQYVRPIVIFLYAASFLVIFLAIITQKGRTAHLELVDGFYVLALFGLFHFLADASLIPMVLSQFLRSSHQVLLVRLGLYLLSFQFLLYFGFMILTRPETRLRWFVYLTPLVIGIHYVIAVNIASNLIAGLKYAALLLAGPSSVVASLAFIYLAIKLGSLHLRSLTRNFWVLAVAFLAFALLKIFIIVNPEEVSLPPMYVLVTRMIVGLVIAFYVMKILAIFKLEPPQQS